MVWAACNRFCFGKYASDMACCKSTCGKCPGQTELITTDCYVDLKKQPARTPDFASSFAPLFCHVSPPSV